MVRLVWLGPWSAAIGVKTLIGNVLLVLVEFMMKTGVLFWWWWWCWLVGWLVVVILFLLEWRWLTGLI